MARFEVTVSDMQSAASKIGAQADEFLNQAKAVMAAAEDLGSKWEGDSQVAFMQEQQQANAWYQSMVTLVQGYVSTLQKAAQTYQESDAQAAADIRAK